MSQSIQNPIPLPSGDAREGRAVTSYSVDLSSGKQIIVIQVDDNNISRVRSIYVNNDSNTDIVCAIAGSNQTFTFGKGTQQYFPVVSQIPFQATFTAALGINKNVTVLLINHDLPQLLGI